MSRREIFEFYNGRWPHAQVEPCYLYVMRLENVSHLQEWCTPPKGNKHITERKRSHQTQTSLPYMMYIRENSYRLAVANTTRPFFTEEDRLPKKTCCFISCYGRCVTIKTTFKTARNGKKTTSFLVATKLGINWQHQSIFSSNTHIKQKSRVSLQILTMNNYGKSTQWRIRILYTRNPLSQSNIRYFSIIHTFY